MIFSPSANLLKVDVKAEIESFFKLNPTFSRNTNIRNLWINLPNSVKLLPYSEQLSKKENKLWKEDKAHFLKEDLIEPVMRILYPEGEYKKIIDKLRQFIPLRDTASLLSAADICSKENKKIKFDDSLARKRLSEANKKRGLILYNWLRSEEVIPFDILPFIESKDNFPDKSSFNTIFSCFWEQFIECHPFRIFVSVTMNKDDIMNEILTRAIFKESKKIIVYSRCSRNKVVGSLLKNLKISYSLGNKIKWNFKETKYKIGLNPAMKVEIIPDFIIKKIKKV